MDYLTFHNQFKDYTLVSVPEIRKSFHSFDLRRLAEWQNKGYLSKIVNGWYRFTEQKMEEHNFFEVANRIYSPSYISLEMALSYHDLIPEAVYGVTSVGTKRTYRLNCSLADFSYRKIAARLFFGYDLVTNGRKTVRIASPEKAVLDYLYFHPDLKTQEDMVSVRFNTQQAVERIDRKKFQSFLERFGSKALSRRARLFWEVLKHD